MTMMATEPPKPKLLINLISLIDIPTASFVTGEKGETIVNGGLQTLTGIIGPGNSYKSAVAAFMGMAALDLTTKATPTHMYIYDSEINTDENRIRMLGSRFKNLEDKICVDETSYVHLTDATVKSGDEWDGIFKTYAADKQKSKDMVYEGLVQNKKPVTHKVPSIVMLDSLSKFESGKTAELVDKTLKDDGSLQTIHMKKGLFKSNFLGDLPRRCSKANIYFITTGHVGQTIDMDTSPMAKYNKPVKKLQYLGERDSLKGLPGDFATLMSIVWFIKNSKGLINKATKLPEYPKSNEETLQTTDLNLIKMIPLRNKHGASGFITELLVSQVEGVLPSLSEFHYIKSYDRFGLEGSNTNYNVILLPEVKLSRTTVRAKLDTDTKLQRAVEILSSLLLLKIYHPQFVSNGLWCTPEELYTGIKEAGYDWNDILETSGKYTPDRYTAKRKELSIVDLLKMRKGLYKPYWMQD
jgi:hypothetical protein